MSSGVTSWQNALLRLAPMAHNERKNRLQIDENSCYLTDSVIVFSIPRQKARASAYRTFGRFVWKTRYLALLYFFN